MTKWLIRFAVVLFALDLAAAQTKKASKTDTEIKQEIIKQSIASYRGSCPCPYNVDRAGRMCGRRSAYSRPGGGLTDLLREGCDAEDGGRLSKKERSNSAMASEFFDPIPEEQNVVLATERVPAKRQHGDCLVETLHIVRAKQLVTRVN
jgi:hypothetical protein